MDPADLAQRARDRIGRVGQAFQRPFHPPFGLGFAGVLAGIEPHGGVPFAHFEQIKRLPVERGGKPDQIDPVTRRGLGHQIVMAFHRVGREIGKPGRCCRRSVMDSQRPTIFILVKTRCGTGPIFAVFGDARIIAGPPAGIGGGVEA